MKQLDWPGRVSVVIASQVRRYRTIRQPRMSLQKLADRTNELGMQIPRSVLANLESGRCEVVTVPELLILARALDVEPAGLLLPADEDGLVEILPGERWPAETLSNGLPPCRPVTPAANKPPAGFTCNACGKAGS